jgi:hypothetical protein
MLRSIAETGDDKLTHSASSQYGRVKPGDHVWIATAWKGGYLALLGRVVVEVCTSQEEAERLLRTTDLWPAFYHVIAKPGTEVGMRLVDISDLASDIEFRSNRGRLSVQNGRVNAQQLQALRELTPSGSALLERRWMEDFAIAGEVVHQVEQGVSGSGDPETNRRVEQAPVRAVRPYYEAKGWSVKSVEPKDWAMILNAQRRVSIDA